MSKAGQDVVLRLPTDTVTLDGRESTDDHAIVQYEWVLLRGDPSVDMKVIHFAVLTETKVSLTWSLVFSFRLCSQNVCKIVEEV